MKHEKRYQKPGCDKRVHGALKLASKNMVATGVVKSPGATKARVALQVAALRVAAVGAAESPGRTGRDRSLQSAWFR